MEPQRIAHRDSPFDFLPKLHTQEIGALLFKAFHNRRRSRAPLLRQRQTRLHRARRLVVLERFGWLRRLAVLLRLILVLLHFATLLFFALCLARLLRHRVDQDAVIGDFAPAAKRNGILCHVYVMSRLRSVSRRNQLSAQSLYHTRRHRSSRPIGV